MAKVLTFNLWHGLSPEGILRFREMEPRTRKRLRHQMQKQLFEHYKGFDFLFFQEANPVEKRSLNLAENLNMEPYFCRDNSGVKWGRWGVPANLDSGLCTLVGEKQYVESTQVLRLSDDGRTFMNEKASFQLSEGRSALLVSTCDKQAGRSLWVNTHLHHGIEISDAIRDQIKDLRKSGKISEGVEEELLMRLQKADDRRSREVTRLLEELDLVKNRYNMIVVAGDLNATPKSSTLQQFYQFGFHSLENGSEPLVSWDPVRNEANHILSRDYIPALLLEDLSFDKKTVSHLAELARSWEYRPRKIDYILGWSQTGKIDVQNSQLIGLPSAQEEMAPSDHFGLVSEFQWSSLAQ